MSPMDAPRLLCDAMLGRLARDLRILGYDTAYAAPDASDTQVLAQARREGRALLTKDRELAARADVPTVLVGADELGSTLAALGLAPRRAALFSRCTECNGALEAGDARPEDGAPPQVRRVSRCGACARVYWAGSHVAGILGRLERHLRD